MQTFLTINQVYVDFSETVIVVNMQILLVIVNFKLL